MKLLKKPYTPIAFTGQTKTFDLHGKSFMQLQAVYLSGTPYTDTQTFYNPFSGVSKLSAANPGFFGVKLLSSQYTTNFDNFITFTIPSAADIGYVDIVAQNPAGYGTLTRYVVKHPYSGTLSLSVLRPWSRGIQIEGFVEFENQIISIDGSDAIVTIAGEYLVNIQ